MIEPRRRLSEAVLLGALALLLIAYLPCLPAPFFSVDDASLIQLPQLQPPFSLRSLATLFRVDSNIDYYPVRDLSYVLDAVLWPGSVIAARLHQLVVFWLGTLFAFGVLRELGAERRVAAVAVALWAAHPFHAETLLWLSARKDVLALTFGLASAYLFLRAARSSVPRRWTAVALVCFACSLLSKASLTLIPLAAFLAVARGRRALALFSALAVVSAFGQNWFYSHVNEMRNVVPLLERLPTSLAAIGRILAGWALPFLNTVDTDTFGEWTSLNRVFIPLGALAWLGFLAFFGRALFRKDRRAILESLLLGAAYLPISGILFAHRSLYSTRYFEPFALVLLLIVTLRVSQGGLALSRTWLAPSRHRFALPILAGLGLLVSGALVAEARHWENNLTIREKGLAVHPESVSLRAYLLGDLINAVSLSQPDERPRLIARRDELIASLERDCAPERFSADGRGSPLLNCAIFYRHAYLVRRWQGDVAGATRYFALFERANQGFTPPPGMVRRMRLENSLFAGAPDRAAFAGWDHDHPYQPNPDYRTLHLISRCLTGTGEPRQELLSFVKARLLTPELVRGYLADHAAPPLRAQLRSCLGL
ncbi:MAG: hypothetical protein NDJ90_03650 [Oligoflexia bacterium]|nr:hypothetical protein [Oligoflexia bacterium]